MTYKNVALYKERQQKSKIERYKVLLYNAICLLEQDYDSIESVCEALGMTSDEYDEIMYN